MIVNIRGGSICIDSCILFNSNSEFGQYAYCAFMLMLYVEHHFFVFSVCLFLMIFIFYMTSTLFVTFFFNNKPTKHNKHKEPRAITRNNKDREFICSKLQTSKNNSTMTVYSQYISQSADCHNNRQFAG